jgi:hypothetical protein
VQTLGLNVIEEQIYPNYYYFLAAHSSMQWKVNGKIEELVPIFQAALTTLENDFKIKDPLSQ